MNLAFSNIAWTSDEEAGALLLLNRYGVTQIEAAPARLWKDPSLIKPLDAIETKKAFEAKGFSISGFQAILFGRPELQLFQEASRDALACYLIHIATLCAAVGGKYLVFGAPKNRWIPEEMDRQEAFEVAVAFFKKFSPCFHQLGVSLGIEANPKAYEGNFCTTAEEVIHLVREVNTPGMHWHLDTGELAMNEEHIPDVLVANKDLIRSFHISQPFLSDFKEPWPGHAVVANFLKESSFKGALSIEMKRQPSGIEAIQNALEVVSRIYA